jgi:integrase
LALGVYPETTLTKAREKRADARKLIGDGIGPSQHRKKEKALAFESTQNTFEAVARNWYENRKSRWRPHYAKEIITRLENDIFPAIGDFPIKEIEPPLLLQAIRKIENSGAHELAKRQLQKCGEIFR